MIHRKIIEMRPEDIRKDSFQKIGLVYREIQLLCKLYGELFQNQLIGGYVLETPMVFVVCAYILIANWSQLPSVAKFVLANAVLMCIGIFLYVFHFAVKVYTESNTMKKTACNGNLVTFTNGRGGKLAKRYWKSMPIVKVGIFNGNFFDEVTPLVILQFSVSTTTNLVLMKE